ncbi:MAG: hypothetical protein EOP88_07135 [Verrucomicrobiaceae bacterium]|nr:MAG: hypothetical protein EOP88_07135 [Verrucomicrobiaceae bacterium]
MKLHPEDPRLTAYVLGELGPEDAAAIKTAVAADPALQAEIAELEAIHGTLTSRLTLVPEQLLPSQRDNIRRTARENTRRTGGFAFSTLREKLQPLLIPTAAATVLMGATFILVRMPQPPEKKPVTATPKPVEAPKPSNQPAPGPADAAAQQAAASAAGNASDLPPLVRRGAIKAVEIPTLDLPVQAGKASLEWVSKAVLENRQLPRHDAVRPEEMLNSFQFRFNGTTAIARTRDLPERHPDQGGNAVAPPVATLSTELIPCPWKPSSTLLLISLRGNPEKSSEVRLSYQSNPGNVSRYRLIGFAPVAGKKEAAHLPATLAADATTVLAIEIEPSKPGSELGSLVWSADGKPAPAITLQHKGDTEPSNDARFAALVCTYAQWLGGEQAGAIDADIVSGLAREIASSDLPPDRSAFLNLIDRSLHL